MRRHLGRATALGVAARRRKAGNLPLLRTLQDLGVATSLELCLDAGDYASYTGSGQSWLDTSGNGYDFFRGADVNASTDDPTWAGTAGALTANEYWSFDGGDWFNYDTTNETWMENLHKDSAAFTFATWVYLGTAANTGFCGTTTSAVSQVGATWWVISTGQPRLTVTNGTANALSQATTMQMAAGQWAFTAVSMDEANGNLIFFLDGTSDPYTSRTYTSPSASAATNRLSIGSRSGTNARLPDASRMAQFMAWSRALSAAELSDIYTKTRTRFGV